MTVRRTLCGCVIVVFWAAGCGDDGGDNTNNQNNGNTKQSICGDGILDPQEACDDGTQNSDTEPDRCRTDCRLPACGDGVVDTGETCDDGNNRNDDGCLSADTSAADRCVPNVCGDGFRDETEVGGDAVEACDDGNTDDGDDCRGDCGQDFTLCGNESLDQGESCDRGTLNSEDPNAECRTDCTLRCCGDGVIDTAHGETCDDGPDNSDTVPDACRSNCTLDSCGDGVKDTDEACDGSDLGGLGCGDLQTGSTGTLACTAGCELDKTGCVNLCGNGVAEGSEVCDGDDLRGDDCEDHSFHGGDLACQSDCTWDTSACTNCGNGVLEAGEDCEGSSVGSHTCGSETAFSQGNLACDAGTCTFDTSNCYTCGNGTIEGPEQCDDDNLIDGDGCSSGLCELEDNWACDGVPSQCVCVVYVDADPGILSRDGGTWATATDDINGAVTAAYNLSQSRSVPCEVWVAEGTYSVWSSAATDTLVLRDGVAVYGGFDGYSTGEVRRDQRDPATRASIISGSDGGSNQVYHVVTADTVTGARLDGVVIRDGYARTSVLDQRGGGGLRLVDSIVTLANSVVEGNLATWGAGFHVQGGTLTVENSIIRDNVASNTGGGFYWSGGTGTLTDVEISGNSTTTTDGGGGLYLYDGVQLTFLRADFVGNEAGGGYGGALYLSGYNSAPQITCTECAFHDNRAPVGGAIHLRDGTDAQFDRCEFVANRGSGSGGALHVWESGTTATVKNSLFMYNFTNLNNGDGGAVYTKAGGTATLTNVTFFANVSDMGGAIYGSGSGDVITLTNCLLSGNRAATNPELYQFNSTHTQTYTASAGTFSGAGNKTVADPLFVHVPVAVTVTTSIPGNNQIVVAHSGFATVGQYIELNDDGVARQVMSVSDTTIGINHSLSGTLPTNVIVVNWGASTNTTEDLRLTSSSLCVDAANGDVATDYDKDNLSPRFDAPGANGGVGTPAYVDMGCYEYR